MMLLWELIPASFRKYIYVAAVLFILGLTIWYQSARIDSLKAQRDTAKAAAASISAAYIADTKALRHAYDAANAATAKYHAAKDKAAITVTVYKEKIVHVYENNPEVRDLLDQPLPCDLLDGMCAPFPGSCYLPSPSETPAGTDGSASTSSPAASCDITVRDVVNNFAEVRGAYASGAARHASLVQFIEESAK